MRLPEGRRLRSGGVGVGTAEVIAWNRGADHRCTHSAETLAEAHRRSQALAEASVPTEHAEPVKKPGALRHRAKSTIGGGGGDN